MFRKYLFIAGFVLTVLPLYAKRHKPVVPDSLQLLEIRVNELSVRMHRVEGGAFVMGATAEQTDADVYTDKPAHLVVLSPYYIAETEVTERLWREVMPDHVSLHPRGYPTNPISYVTWMDCQEFIRRLDSITGIPFRLPTEAEWEFAARGGNQSKHYRFAGGHEADSVGWTNNNSGNWSHPVASKRPNELGLYDMTGNVSEWCEDWYAPYQLGSVPNPCVCDSGEYKIVRGGSYDECIANSHLSIRQWYTPQTSHGYIGFRLAFTLPDDPMLQPQTEEPALTKKIHVGGRKLAFSLVPGDEPYYISEEVSVNLWRKMMYQEPPRRQKSIALGMSASARKQFAELCARDAKEALTVASAAQIITAEQQGIIEPFMPERKKRDKDKSIKEIQQQRRATDKLSPWAELLGVKVKKSDDPILSQFQTADNDSRPLRLVMRISQIK